MRLKIKGSEGQSAGFWFPCFPLTDRACPILEFRFFEFATAKCRRLGSPKKEKTDPGLNLGRPRKIDHSEAFGTVREHAAMGQNPSSFPS